MSDTVSKAKPATGTPGADKRSARDAVGWMLGPELIGQLAKIFGRRRDPRGWMPRRDAFLHDEYISCDGHLRHAARASEARAIDRAETPDRNGDAGPTERTEIWFDYVSDLGDSSDAMYAVAVACLASFTVDKLPTALSKGAKIPIKLRCDSIEASRELLPRGQFLFVGGDTAYHVADEPTIKARVEEPFRWADQDLERIGAVGAVEGRPRLYGIPGNHDWYDNLDGYRLLFQRDAFSNSDRPEPAPNRSRGVRGLQAWSSALKPDTPSSSDEKRGLDRFVRVQRASYVAIQLPHRWQIWGLDIDQPIDPSQERYFISLKPRDGQPERLILCTPSPPIVFEAAVPTKQHASAVRKLGLAAAYLDSAAQGAEPIPPECLRLDLSGDIHHYARYESQDASPRYKAVVSGLGGAFHHPSFTKVGARERKAEYPLDNISRERIATGLLTARVLFVGSWIRALPFLFALCLGSASTANGAIGHFARRVFSHEPGDVSAAAALEKFTSALVLLLTLTSSVLLLRGAVKTFDATFEAQSKDPSLRQDFLSAFFSAKRSSAFGPFRSYWLSTGLAVLAIGLPIALVVCPKAPDKTAWLDILAIAIVAFGLVIGPLLAVRFGAKHISNSRAPFAALGFVHGIAQVVTPFLAAHAATASIGSASRAWWESPVAAVLAIAVPWGLLPLARSAFKKASFGCLMAFGIGSVLWSLAILSVGGGLTIHYDPLGWRLIRYAVGALVAMVLGTINLTWYFAIAASMNGHNNEVGGAARITGFRQLIRFHINARGGLTGYAIAIEDRDANAGPPLKQGAPAQSLEFSIVDVFSLGDTP